jgi:hypothetical protein
MTAIAVVVFLSTKFLEGAWVVVIAIPLMMWLFSHTETYYAKVASELRLGKTPGIPHARESVVVVPTSTVNLLTQRALDAALSLGDTVVAVAVAGNEEEQERIKQDWDQWKCSVPLEVVIDPHRSLVRTVLDYVESIPKDQVTVTVLIPELIPTKRRREILHNQRGRLLEAALKSRSDVVVATLPFHVKA